MSPRKDGGSVLDRGWEQFTTYKFSVLFISLMVFFVIAPLMEGQRHWLFAPRNDRGRAEGWRDLGHDS